MKCFPVIGLPVETQHGKMLGKVVNIELDSQTAAFIAMHVAPNTTVRNILHTGPELLIKQEQIVEITPTKIFVVDLMINDPVDAGEQVEDLSGGRAIKGHLPSMIDLE